jgi:hypothetical protein
MSWWDDGDDILGDGPADAITAAWRTVLARREQDGQPPPATAEALESFAAALRRTQLAPPFGSMVLWRDRDRVSEFSGSGGVDELTAAFAEAMQKIARDYQRRFERPPRPSEIIKTLDFVLRPSPETYLSDGRRDEWQHLRLRAG